MKPRITLLTVAALLFSSAPTTLAQAKAELLKSGWKILAGIATGVSIAKTAKGAADFVVPPVTDLLLVATRDSWVPGAGMYLAVENITTGPLTGVSLVYTSKGAAKTYSVGTVEPRQTKKLGWAEGAPMISAGDTVTISANGARSVSYKF